MVYVSVASSPTTSMPSTKLRMSAFRSGFVPSCKKSRKSVVYQFQMFYWRPSPGSDSVHRISCYRGLKRYGKASPTAWSVKDPAMNPATHLEIVFCCLAISDCC